MAVDNARGEQTPLPPVHEAWLPREHSMHRPRHGPRQRAALAAAALFFATPLVALTAGVSPPEIENHRLASFPSPLAGWQFFTALPDWATDHLVFRDSAISAADSVSRGVFGEPPVLGAGDSGARPGVLDRPKVSRDIAIPAVIEGKSGWMYLGDDVVSRCKQANSVDTTLAQLRKLRDGVEASGREFVLVVAPDKTTVVPQYLPDQFVGTDCLQQVNTELWNLLSTEDFVLDLRAELVAWGERDGAPVYTPLDAHWSDEGGLTMTKALAEAIAPGVTSTWGISPREPWTVPGDLPPLIGRSGDITGTHFALRPDGVFDQAREVPTDFTSPLSLSSAVGPGTVPGKVGLLGDSFSIRALRYLAGAFQDLTVLHYGKTAEDSGRLAGRMLADQDVVAIEVVERTLASGNNMLLRPEVVDGIVAELAAQPRR